jgi:hypothetical protein
MDDACEFCVSTGDHFFGPDRFSTAAEICLRIVAIDGKKDSFCDTTCCLMSVGKIDDAIDEA